MAKKFFYVCAGLCLLVGAFALGAVSVRAQAVNTFSIAHCDYALAGGYVGVINRVVVEANVSGGGVGVLWTSPPVPGDSPIVGVEGGTKRVILANGDCYQFGGGGWELVGNMLTGVVSASPERRGDDLQLSVVPTPSNRVINARYSLRSAGDVDLEVLDTQGRCVAKRHYASQQAGTHESSVDLTDTSRLAPGTYFLRVRSGGSEATSKVVVLQ